MRRVLLATYGSLGDLHPYLAMGAALRDGGDAVTVATHAEYREACEQQGLGFVALPPSAADVGPESEWAAQANNRFQGTKFVIQKLILPYLDASFEVLDEQASRHDLVVPHMLTFAAPVAAEKRRVPWLSCALAPIAMFSAYDPGASAALPFMPSLGRRSPAIVRGLYRLVEIISARSLQPVAELRQRVGLPPAPNPLTSGFSPLGTLALFPELFGSPQADWPRHTRCLGFPLFDPRVADTLSSSTQAFLSSGPPPIVFTLGSAIVLMETDFFSIAYEAVKRSGSRAIFLAGKSPRVPEAARLDAAIHIAEYEPFGPLFPRARAIVHQCGVGTTAKALASGRPQICVPHAHDQFDNAARVKRLGAGTVVAAHRLTVNRLADAIDRIDSLADAAERAGASVRAGSFPDRLREAVNTLAR
jgi:rhamnosyltransferase subunit B